MKEFNAIWEEFSDIKENTDVWVRSTWGPWGDIRESGVAVQDLAFIKCLGPVLQAVPHMDCEKVQRQAA